MDTQQATPVPTQEDRVIAGACHLTPFVGFPILAPFAVYFWKKDDRFIAFHALQAGIFHLVCVPIMMFGYMAGIVGSILIGVLGAGAHAPGLGFAFGAGSIFVLGLGGPGMILLIITVFAGYRALMGDPFHIPLVGRLVDKILEAPATRAAQTPTAPAS